MTDITEPNAYGTVEGEEEESLCLASSEASLQAVGAIIGGCEESEVTEPESTTGAEPESDEGEWDSGPLGLYADEDSYDCTGGGTISVQATDTYTVDITVKVGSKTGPQIETEALDKAVKGFKGNRENALLAQPNKACVEANCQGECEPKSSWASNLKGTSTILGAQHYNIGTSSYHIIVTVKVELTRSNTLRVACICEE